MADIVGFIGKQENESINDNATKITESFNDECIRTVLRHGLLNDMQIDSFNKANQE